MRTHDYSINLIIKFVVKNKMSLLCSKKEISSYDWKASFKKCCYLFPDNFKFCTARKNNKYSSTVDKKGDKQIIDNYRHASLLFIFVKYLKEIYLTTYLILLKKMIFFLNISGLIYKMRYIGIEGMSLKPLPYFWKIDYKEYYWMTKLLYGNQC